MQHLQNRLSKFLSFIVCLYLLFTPACRPVAVVESPAPPTADLVVHGDMAFSKKDRLAVEESCREWSRATSGQAKITMAWDLDSKNPASPRIHQHHHILLKISQDDPFIGYLDETTNSYHLGFTSPPGGIYGEGPFGVKVVVIRDRIEDQDMLSLITLHEFGHLLGAHHVRCDEKCVMSAGYREMPPCLTKHDTDEFCKANSCDRPMSPCVR